MNIASFEIEATDGQGDKHVFSVSVKTEVGPKHRLFDQSLTYEQYSFDVQNTIADPESMGYTFRINKYSDGLIRVDTMSHNSQSAFKRKGITPKMIEWVSKFFQSPIESSSKQKQRRLNNEWREDEATIVWEKMVARGQAFYDESRDVYIYPVPVESDL